MILLHFLNPKNELHLQAYRRCSTCTKSCGFVNHCMLHFSIV